MATMYPVSPNQELYQSLVNGPSQLGGGTPIRQAPMGGQPPQVLGMQGSPLSELVALQQKMQAGGGGKMGLAALVELQKKYFGQGGPFMQNLHLSV